MRSEHCSNVRTGVPTLRLGLLVVLFLGALAALTTTVTTSDPFEVRLVRLQAQEKIPSIADSLQQESPSINALFLSYANCPSLWMSASLAIEKHGDLARRMLLEYGLVSEFQDVLIDFGADAVLPVGYFYSNDLATLRLQHWLGESAGQVGRWWREEEPLEKMELDAHTRGLIGINLLRDKRYELINQFDVNDEGELIRLFGEATVSKVSGFFTSGLRDLERQWRQGGEVGTATFAWAGLDLLVMTSAVKILRVGKAARAGRAPGGQAVGGAVAARSVSALAPAAKVAIVSGMAIAVIRHPSLISGLGANLADWMGWPAWIGKFLMWLLAFAVLFGVLRVLFGPMLFVTAPLARSCLRWVERKRAAKASGALANS